MKRKPFIIDESKKQVVQYLWEGHTVQEAADLTGVSRSTVWRWFKQPKMQAYAEKYNHAKDAAYLRKLRREVCREAGDEWIAQLKYESEHRNEIRAAELREFRSWLKKNHVSESERKAAIEAFEAKLK